MTRIAAGIAAISGVLMLMSAAAQIGSKTLAGAAVAGAFAYGLELLGTMIGLDADMGD